MRACKILYACAYLLWGDGSVLEGVVNNCARLYIALFFFFLLVLVLLTCFRVVLLFV